jgi:four helix bundle protein
MKSVRPHKNLIVWKESIQLVKSMYKLSKQLPDNERFGIISQLQRASVSVAANIAEGAARNTTKEFLRFLHIANGSLSEVDTLLVIVLELGYVKNEAYSEQEKQLDKIGALLNGLIRKLRSQLLPNPITSSQ